MISIYWIEVYPTPRHCSRKKTNILNVRLHTKHYYCKCQLTVYNETCNIDYSIRIQNRKSRDFRRNDKMLFRLLIFIVVAYGLLIVGCGKEENKPKQASKIARKPAKLSKPTPPSSKKLIPADDKDDPRFALLFPESDKVAGWIKTSPVTGGGREKVSSVLPQLADILKPFAIENISAARYERIYRGKVEQVNCCLIRAKNSDDAYGMLSVSCPGPDGAQFGDVTRTLGNSQTFSVKGVYFGIFQSKGEDKAHLRKGLERLAAKIMFEIASQGGPPMVVQMLTTEDMPQATVLFMRNLISITGPAGKNIKKAIGLSNVESMNKLLELGKDVDFALASYENKDWPGPDVLWIAKYPTAKQAFAVYTKYRKILNRASPGGKLDENTMIKAPRGRFLLGCWSMETESLAHLMGKAYEHLP